MQVKEANSAKIVEPKFQSKTANKPAEIETPLKNELEKVKQTNEIARADISDFDIEEQIKETDDTLGRVLSNPIVKTIIPGVGNITSLVFNGVSSYANTFSTDAKFKKFATKLGSAGTKLFQITNGTINCLEQYRVKNHLSAFGNAIDAVIGIFVSQPLIYLAKGISVGLYTIANSLSILNKQNEFGSMFEHIEHVKEGLSKSFKLFFKDPVKNLRSSETGLLGTVSGFIMMLGSFSWMITKNEKLGASIRDAAGFLVDFEQAKPSHLAAGRKYYFATGITYICGTACDLLSKFFPKKKSILVPFGFFTDVIARELLRQSQIRGELK